MESDLHIRVKVLELLSTSLKAEHFLEIQRMHPDYPCVDHDDPDNLLYFLEKEKQCISMKCYNGLVVLLNKLGLDEVANEIIAFHETPEKEYLTLKSKIEAIFKDRNCRKEYMEKFRSGIVECYNFEKGDILESTMNEIIHDLENSQQLSRSMSHILRFQNVFKSCGCTNVVDLINSFENVMRLKEETPVDTSDAGAANTRPTPQQYAYPSQSTQEQNPGSSGPTTGQHPSTFNPASSHWRNPGIGEPTGQTAGFHQSANLHPHPFNQPHFQRRPQELQGTPCIYNTSNVGLNFNFGPYANINEFHSSQGSPGLGISGRGHYGAQQWNHGQGGQGNHGQGDPGQWNHGLGGQGDPGQWNLGHGQGIYGQGSPGQGNHGQGMQGNPGQGDPGQWNHGQGGQGIYGQGSPGQGIHRQGSPGQDDYGRRNHGQGANKYFPRQ
ncbi:translation initiation factor IF-2-like isoform X2 [Anneissia japonica]|uniref:translation initiation factor IF-2-like isoform X2 n=1 Tax=Anneissia japonica TaxID=1529436 RepID=UPI001425ABB2|nr:translation initiation factor IF-2-like isoform X2 [Anneissia japonica]